MPEETKRRKADGGDEGATSVAQAKIAAYLREQSPAHRETIDRLRRLVKAAVPELEERMRWMQIGYLDSGDDVCGIYASGDHVNLSFWQGARLKDPKGLLEGTGKGMRHIKIFRIEDVGASTIKAYVREAAASAMSPRRIEQN